MRLDCSLALDKCVPNSKVYNHQAYANAIGLVVFVSDAICLKSDVAKYRGLWCTVWITGYQC